mmetsp:Transcript_20203/g.44245  ORF Transcript_20203/g.44245 Transcript_20203/m.44245 type:complete len:202 (-) Transcript_20203:773-1378(-)
MMTKTIPPTSPPASAPESAPPPGELAPVGAPVGAPVLRVVTFCTPDAVIAPYPANAGVVKTAAGAAVRRSTKPSAASGGVLSESKRTEDSTSTLPASMESMVTKLIGTLAEAAICEMNPSRNVASKAGSPNAPMSRVENVTVEVTVSYEEKVGAAEGAGVPPLISGPAVGAAVGAAVVGARVGARVGAARKRLRYQHSAGV